MTILQDIYQLKPSNLITLYTLDLSPCIGRYGATTTDVYRWCDGVNELGNDIIWNGVSYTRYPIQASGFDKQGNGSIPRPKLIAGNYGGIIGNLARDYNDIVGARLTRVRTFARYLDASNYGAKNYYIKSNNFGDAAWTKNGVAVLQSLSAATLAFRVGSKVSITNNNPSVYNTVKATVLTSTTNTITIASAATGSLVLGGTLSNSEYSTTITAVSGTGSIATITFEPLTVYSPIPNEPVCAITESSTNTTHYINKATQFSYKAGTTYCKSIYVCAGLRTNIRLGFPAGIFNDNLERIASFNLLTGSVIQSLSSSNVYTSINKIAGTNWYRCTLSITAEKTTTPSNSTADFCLYNDSNQISYAGDPTVVALLVSCPQISSGSIYPVEYYAEANSSINTNPYADTNQYLDKEIWSIDRKSNENSAYVEWELTAPYDLIGVKIPRRQCIQNVCSWKYRGAECGYTGTSYFNINDGIETLPANDICGKRVSSCKKRFPNQALPYGGFPSIDI